MPNEAKAYYALQTPTERYEYQRDRAVIRAAERMREREEAARLVVENRDPCFACGIPGDRHDAHGCSRYCVPRR